MTTNESSGIRPQRDVRRFRHAVAATALVATVALPSVTHAGTVSDNDPIYLACLRSAGSTADALERSADRCANTAANANPRYVACMRSAASTPDALEHWVDYCVGSALGESHHSSEAARTDRTNGRSGACSPVAAARRLRSGDRDPWPFDHRASSPKLLAGAEGITRHDVRKRR